MLVQVKYYCLICEKLQYVVYLTVRFCEATGPQDSIYVTKNRADSGAE